MTETCENGKSCIEAKGLKLSYGDHTAFADLNLQIRCGGITTMIGPSGCGKTSFLYSLNRMTDYLKNCRVTGQLRFNDIDILSAKTDVLRLRRRIGMIFQKPGPFPMSIRRNIELPLREHGIKPASRRAFIIEEALQNVGLWNEVKDRLDAPALNLSGGQQQRLCIARAIALHPEVILMDEPCSSLDPISAGVVEDLIVRLSERYTILLVTHNLAQARRIADHACFFWLKDGAGGVIESGPAERLFSEPKEQLTKEYLLGVRA